MKTVKIAEATPLQIDYLVAKAEGCEVDKDFLCGGVLHTSWHFNLPGEPNTWRELRHFKPSTNPTQGHPILEREGISPIWLQGGWFAFSNLPTPACLTDITEGHYGPTMLIAGLRCFLVSRLGDIAEVPEELA